MKIIDIGLILICCLFWGANVPLTQWALHDAPPMFFAACRFFSVAIILLPFAFPVPREIFKIFLIAMLVGGLNFVFLYYGLETTPSSISAILGQMSLPMSIVFSVILLGERPSKYRVLGIIIAFIGVWISIYKPIHFKLGIGVLYVLASASLTAFGNILLKKVKPISAIKLQAWISLFSFFPVAIGSYFSERLDEHHLWLNEFKIVSVLFFSVVFVTIFAHTSYFRLLKKYDLSQVVPYTATTPFWTVLIARFAFGEHVDPKMFIGAIICAFGITLLSIDFKSIKFMNTPKHEAIS